MRLLFVSHEYIANGSTWSLINMVNNLIDSGTDVDVMVPRKGTAMDLLKKNHISLKSFLYFTDYKSLNKPWKFYQIYHELWNYFAVIIMAFQIIRCKYDFVVSNSSAVDVAARACRLIGRKHVYYVREFMEEDFSIEYRNKRRLRHLLEKSDGVIFISKCIKDKYINLYNIDHFIQVYDGINISDYVISNHDILMDKVLKFVSVGTICKGKGTLDTVKYIEKIKKICDCRLTIVGHQTGEYFKTVQKYVGEHGMSDYISFAGYTTDVKEYLAQSDILIINSQNEGLGRVTIEAMMAGCLVVGRASGGTLEIIADGITGLSFKDENEFLSKVRCVINDPNFYRRIAENGRKYAVDKFDPKLCADSVIHFLNEIDGANNDK